VQPGESSGGAEAPSRAGQGSAPTMDSLEEINVWTIKREESAPSRQVAAVFPWLRARSAIHERG